jgi:hypothetical protein
VHPTPASAALSDTSAFGNAPNIQLRDWRPEGTIRIVAPDPTRKFDVENARVMQRLAVFTATALNLANSAREPMAEASRPRAAFPRA